MAQIELKGGFVTLVDDDVADELRMVSWTAWEMPSKYRTYRYAVRHLRVDGKKVLLLLHRLVMTAPKGAIVDHINGDTLDNRSVNLRLCTHAENMRNRQKNSATSTSRFKGVWRYGSRWEASITTDGQVLRVGVFTDEEDAARAYDAAAIRLHGEFARPNFPKLQAKHDECELLGDVYKAA